MAGRHLKVADLSLQANAAGQDGISIASPQPVGPASARSPPSSTALRRGNLAAFLASLAFINS